MTVGTEHYVAAAARDAYLALKPPSAGDGGSVAVTETRGCTVIVAVGAAADQLKRLLENPDCDGEHFREETT